MTATSLYPLLLFLLAALVSGAGTWLFLRWPGRTRFIKGEPQTRWRKGRISTGGGPVIALTFFAGLLIAGVDLALYWPLLAGAMVLFSLGLWDDLRPIKPHIKLSVQVGAACLAIALGLNIKIAEFPALGLPLTIFWLVGITNAFNLLDNMDGLAGGIALIAAAFLYFFAGAVGQELVRLPAALLAGAVLGFLVFNWHPARIYMGDSGALFIGFTLAGLGIIGTWQQASNILFILLAPAMFMIVPIFDTTLVTVLRKINDRPISEGGKDHTSHRLVFLGYSEGQAVAILYGLAVVFGLLTLLGLYYDFYVVSLLLVLFFVAILVFGLFLADTRIYDKKSAEARPTLEMGRRIQVMYKRRILEVMIDLLIFFSAYYAAFLLRYEGALDAGNRALLAQSLPILLATKLGAFFLLGVYTGVWRYIAFNDLGKYLSASLTGSVTTIIILVGLYRFQGYSRSFFVIDFALTFLLTCGVRFALRALRESLFTFIKGGKKVLVVGAGEAGSYILNEIRKHRELGVTPVGLLDDDPKKIGRRLLGVPVLGPVTELPVITTQMEVEEIIVAIPSATDEQRLRIDRYCEIAGIKTVHMQNLSAIFGRRG